DHRRAQHPRRRLCPHARCAQRVPPKARPLVRGPAGLGSRPPRCDVLHRVGADHSSLQFPAPHQEPAALVTETPAAARPQLTFFFPAYNEEENVERTVQLALEQIGPMVDSLEVLIVDDGSSDRTPELADQLAAADSRVHVFHQPNRGYGGALKAGFANASGRLIAFSDGDLQFDLNELRLLLDRLDDPGRKKVDAVIGWRIKRRDPFHRLFSAKTYNAVVSVASALRAGA